LSILRKTNVKTSQKLQVSVQALSVRYMYTLYKALVLHTRVCNTQSLHAQHTLCIQQNEQ